MPLAALNVQQQRCPSTNAHDKLPASKCSTARSVTQLALCFRKLRASARQPPPTLNEILAPLGFEPSAPTERPRRHHPRDARAHEARSPVIPPVLSANAQRHRRDGRTSRELSELPGHLAIAATVNAIHRLRSFPAAASMARLVALRELHLRGTTEVVGAVVHVALLVELDVAHLLSLITLHVFLAIVERDPLSGRRNLIRCEQTLTAANGYSGVPSIAMRVPQPAAPTQRPQTPRKTGHLPSTAAPPGQQVQSPFR